jgi:hypothetical protein
MIIADITACLVITSAKPTDITIFINILTRSLNDKTGELLVLLAKNYIPKDTSTLRILTDKALQSFMEFLHANKEKKHSIPIQELLAPTLKRVHGIASSLEKEEVTFGELTEYLKDESTLKHLFIICNLKFDSFKFEVRIMQLKLIIVSITDLNKRSYVKK